MTREEIDELWKSVAVGDYGPAMARLSPDITASVGLDGSPWRSLAGIDAVATVLLELAEQFGETYRAERRCLYVDDQFSVELVHETGTDVISGEKADNMVVWINRYGLDGKITNVRTFYVDPETAEAFIVRNPLHY